MTPARLFAFLCRHGLALEAPLALRWWLALCQSPHAQSRWLLRKFSGYHGSFDTFGAWVWRALPPKTLVEVCEILHSEERLTRQDATTIEEALFGLMMAKGEWK